MNVILMIQVTRNSFWDDFESCMQTQQPPKNSYYRYLRCYSRTLFIFDFIIAATLVGGDGANDGTSSSSL